MPSIYRTVVGYRKRTSENCAICPIYKHHWKPAVPEQRNRQVEKNPERIQSERCSPIQSAAYRRFPPDRIRLHHRRSFPQTGPLQSKHNFGYLYTLIRKSIPACDRCYDRCNRPGEEEKKGEMTSKQQNKQQGQKFRKRKKNENPADVDSAGFLREVPSRFELENKGFADLRLTTWLWHRKKMER